MSENIQKPQFAVLTRNNELCSCSIGGKAVSLTEFIQFFKKGILDNSVKLIQDDNSTLVYQF